MSQSEIVAAEVVLPCVELHETLAFFTEELGFRVEQVMPADDPAEVTISGHGLRVLLRRGPGPAGVLRLVRRGGPAQTLVAPNGTRIEVTEAEPALVIPALAPELVISRSADRAWVVGRAGMHYRDLLPTRLGGRFVASHIRIREGGPVPDYVHHHRVRFQMIYCRRGWVRVVYQDQGPPFVLEPGDCVLQPPGIRHQVLECSAGLEVIELGCPALHETRADHELRLPNATIDLQREYAGQRFVRHVAAQASWADWRRTGFRARDTGIAAATGGLASVQVIRVDGRIDEALRGHDAELVFGFVLAGSATLVCEDREPGGLEVDDAFVVPAGLAHALRDCSTDLELLEVALPADYRLLS